MATREPELYKDKIEVSLDGRQIFYLFFGGAVIVGLVFVLGVTVGRRVEARGHVEHARTTAAEDPLAALDRLEANGGMTFKGALTGGQPASQVEQKVAAIEKEKKEDKKADKPAEKKVEKALEKPAEKPVEKKAEPEKKPEPEKKVEKPAEPEKKAEADKKPDKPKDDQQAPASKFTLQLSSFQDKHEADTFLGTIKAAGYAAYITEADVSGKTFYRVRLGNYRTLEAANDAKVDVEKTLKKTATVMKL